MLREALRCSSGFGEGLLLDDWDEDLLVDDWCPLARIAWKSWSLGIRSYTMSREAEAPIKAAVNEVV